MLSSMETPLGLTVIGPRNEPLRITRGSPAFKAGKEILAMSMPAEQAWLKLQEVVANPLKALVSWCERFGVRLTDEGETLKLNDLRLNTARWMPLIQRTRETSGSLKHVMAFAQSLNGEAEAANVANVCLHLKQTPLGEEIAVLMLQDLPEEAMTGDLVSPTGSGDTPFLVSYDKFEVDADGTLKMLSGAVMSKSLVHSTTEDILMQPMVLGHNRTYRCEEGTPDGWLEDMSFDSLKEAQLNAKEIAATGAEVRIINRITKEQIAF